MSTNEEQASRCQPRTCWQPRSDTRCVRKAIFNNNDNTPDRHCSQIISSNGSIIDLRQAEILNAQEAESISHVKWQGYKNHRWIDFVPPAAHDAELSYQRKDSWSFDMRPFLPDDNTKYNLMLNYDDDDGHQLTFFGLTDDGEQAATSVPARRINRGALHQAEIHGITTNVPGPSGATPATPARTSQGHDASPVNFQGFPAGVGWE